MKAQGAIHLHLEQLVIDETLLRQGGERALHGALQEELGRLVRQENLGAISSMAITDLSTSLNVTTDQRPESLGREIARAVSMALRAQSLAQQQNFQGGKS